MFASTHVWFTLSQAGYWPSAVPWRALMPLPSQTTSMSLPAATFLQTSSQHVAGAVAAAFSGGRFVRGFAFALILLAATCHPGCSCTPPKPPPPVDVSAASLVRLYRDTPHIANSSYTGLRIRVRLEPKTYKVNPDGLGWPAGVGWFAGFADTPPVIVFHCAPPADNTKALEVVGVCNGMTRDGVRRAPGINWCLDVADCSVTASP